MKPACIVLLALIVSLHGGTLVGHVRDMNWYAQRQGNPFGVGYYEYAVNANATNNVAPGGFAGTDIFGAFSMPTLPAGNYTVSSWDVWWRPAFAFNVPVPASGSSADVDLRLKATMWGYPAFWDDTGYHEFGQTFLATGPISMIYLRAPFDTSYTLTVRTNGPGGTSVGASRTFSGAGDHRLIYGYGDMPTVAGGRYYVRIRTASPSVGGVIMQMDPRPDFSDPMPGGCLWLGDGTTMVPYPDRDLGLVIMSDDDGLITDLYTRASGPSWSGTSVGQTFIARGVSLVSAAFWLADPSAPTYVARILQGGPGGTQVGTTKRNKPARLGADPEMIVTWAPGECPLVPGQTYYAEITREGGGTFNAAYVNTSNPFSFGTAWRNGVTVNGTDLAGTLMEEESPGSAAMPTVKLTVDPNVADVNRRTNRLTVQWMTDVQSDSMVEFAANTPPYTGRLYDARLTGSHAMFLTNVQPHTMYHFRVVSARPGYRSIVSRDVVICTSPLATNLLANPGFEEGSGSGPARAVTGWVKSGSLNIMEADGTWFSSMPPHSGGWLLQAAVNGSTSDGYVYQRVGVQRGLDYTFSAWVTTWPRENDTWKYDVWDNQGRLIYMRLGIDPTGGTNVNASTVQWTPRIYSHRHWSNLARTAVAQSSNLTVFVTMKGLGGQWHLYGLDDCALTHEEVPVRFEPARIVANEMFQAVVTGRIGTTNIIERSFDLTNWQRAAVFVNSNGAALFQDTATNAQRFYRARQ